MTTGRTQLHRDAPTVVVAGAAGNLGGRITAHLLTNGANVRALLRIDAPEDERKRIRAIGASPVSVNVADVGAVAEVCEGAQRVVSALSGLPEIILDRQSVLLHAAARARIPRFISSDFCSDYTETEPGHNRNFDLRREFTARANQAPIAVTSIFNGAFMHMVGAELPIIRRGIRRNPYWGSADQPLDFTTRDDTAAYTAAAAPDDATPRSTPHRRRRGQRAGHRRSDDSALRPRLPPTVGRLGGNAGRSRQRRPPRRTATRRSISRLAGIAVRPGHVRRARA